jgi:hypothetical protein
MEATGGEGGTASDLGRPLRRVGGMGAEAAGRVVEVPLPQV